MMDSGMAKARWSGYDRKVVDSEMMTLYKAIIAAMDGAQINSLQCK